MTQPRDRLGRPLRGQSAQELSFPQVPERTFIDVPTAWNETLNYLAQDLPFHVHEVFEQRWRCAPVTEKELWQALAQWGAALTHLARGNSQGARALALRSQETLALAEHIPPYMDLSLIRESQRELLA